MITYEIKINGQVVKRIDIRRIHTVNPEMDESGYPYVANVFDYENERLYKCEVTHKRQDNEGKLLQLVFEKLTMMNLKK